MDKWHIENRLADRVLSRSDSFRCNVHHIANQLGTALIQYSINSDKYMGSRKPRLIMPANHPYNPIAASMVMIGYDKNEKLNRWRIL